jgi:hypothetical protein
MNCFEEWVSGEEVQNSPRGSVTSIETDGGETPQLDEFWSDGEAKQLQIV